MLTIVENELLHNLETYYFLDGISHIPVEITTEMMNQEYTVIELSQPLLIEYYQYIAKNLISKIEKLEPNHEYTIPTGWMTHAVCVSFRRIDDTHKISIRIDNPSSGNPPGAHRIYPTADRYNLIEPRILGQLNMNDLENNSNHFISLVDSVKRDLTPKKGISLIYNLNGQIQNLKKKRITNVPSIAEQAAANCFVKCFEPGFRIRLGPTHQKLCEQLLSFEKDNANLLASRCKENHRRDPIEFSICFALLAMEDDPIILPIALKIRLQQKLKASYQHYYRQLSSFFTRGGCKLLTEKYVPLQFEKDHIPIDLESLFVKNRVLVLGEAGSGKTTVCQYITYSWARTKIGKSKFEWLFYIKMRNLNSKRYPLQSNNYSLIDIIEKECFQG
ncbi:unnamed protein product [Rotaria sordida]|uniref:NACHT domain-containing protein n=1 Tax=Rotaria sordida TaxID=392033 RepID=A0A814HPM8_9BILA|nr:unnamed protein product [Rotaria sordida]CAF1273840.1 unnamed protein product [Rotaria sordida]